MSGNITITNPAPMAATITSVTDSVGGVTADVDCGGVTTIPAGEWRVCTYSAALPNGTSRTNTATVTAYGAAHQGTAAVAFVTPTNVVNSAVHVTDTQRRIGNGERRPDVDLQQAVCLQRRRRSAPQHGDASSDQTAASRPSRRCTVNCYGLTVTKSAVPTFTRTYGWAITKTVDVATWNLFAGSERDVELHDDGDQGWRDGQRLGGDGRDHGAQIPRR